MSKVNSEIVKREIVNAFERIGISGRGLRSRIAEVCQITPGAVSAWFRNHDQKQPSIDNCIQIADATNTTLDQLVRGKSIAMLEYDTLADFLQNSNNEEYRIRDLISEVLNNKGQLISLIADDDSMLQMGTKNYYPKGAILVFRIEDKKPAHEDLVLVKIIKNNREFFMFRQYIQTAGKEYFSPFNPAFEKISDYDSYEIVGFFVYQVIK